MSLGHKVTANPENWRIIDEKLYFFFSENGRDRWSSNTTQWIKDAKHMVILLNLIKSWILILLLGSFSRWGGVTQLPMVGSFLLFGKVTFVRILSGVCLWLVPLFGVMFDG